MQHVKGFTTILIAVVLTIGILGSATTSQAKNWKSGHPAPPGTPFDVAHQKFIDMVKEKIDGKIIIDGFPAEQLGPYRDMFSNVVLGVQEMGFLPASPEFSPVLQAITTTYIADSWEDVRKITRPGGWMFNMLEPVFDKLGIKMLGILPCGFEGFANIKGPVLTPEDITKKNTTNCLLHIKKHYRKQPMKRSRLVRILCSRQKNLSSKKWKKKAFKSFA